MRIPCRFGFLPIGPPWYYISCSIRRMSTELPILLGWIKMMFLMIFARSEKVYALPTVWPDVSMMGINNMRRVAGYDFHHIRKKYDVPSMWGNIRTRWRLLQQHLETKGPGWYSLAEREERLFTNRSNPGDDMTDVLRTDNDAYAWHAWRTAHDQL